MLKFADNPPVKPAAIQSVADLSGDWWVAHTKSRAEKALAWHLHDRGIGYFLPMALREMVSGGRRRKVMTPLFTSYVFFCGGTEDRYAVMTTDKACQVIPVRDRQQFVDELVAVERALASGLKLDHFPFATPGRRCRVTHGPLQGVEGKIVYRDNVARLVLEVSILGQGASLEIGAHMLEPLD